MTAKGRHHVETLFVSNFVRLSHDGKEQPSRPGPSRERKPDRPGAGSTQTVACINPQSGVGRDPPGHGQHPETTHKAERTFWAFL